VTTIAVTGASGFAGGAVCRAAVAAGLRVLAFGRRALVDPAHVGGAPYRSWDLTSGEVPELPPVDAVVHCAGSVTEWGPSAQLHLVNAEGTRRVLAAFPPPARFVHVSTASVYDPFRPTVMATEEEAPVSRYVNASGASKAAAERIVAAARRDAIVLRPHAVYGPGDPTLLPRVLGAVRHGRLWLPGGGRVLTSLTSIGNLTAACLAAATGPARAGVCNVADAEPVTVGEALTALLAELGADARIATVPPGLARPLAAAAELALKLTRRPHPPRLTRYAIGHLAVERTLELGAARRLLGYRPAPTSFAGAAAWFPSPGW
jgi:nucleoside-diphosphate-sugar epimerase